MTRTRSAALVLLLLAAPAAPAQVAYPPRPDQSDVHFRYRIRTDRDERIRQFRAMTERLKQLGFAAAPREDADLDILDPAAEFMNGTIPTAGAFQLLGDPRIQAVVAMPAGYQLPEDGQTPVPVRVWLTTGLAASQQRELHEQTARHLGFLGFREGIAYDHRGYTVLRGSLPAGNVLALLKDLRTQPTGWFLPAVSADALPSPFRDVLPVRYVEVLPAAPAKAAPAPAPAPEPADAPAVQPVSATQQAPEAPATLAPVTAPADNTADKLTTELQRTIGDAKAQGEPLRVDLILHAPPDATWDAVRTRIRSAADGLSVEGLIGTVVSVRVARGGDVLRLATLDEVRNVRLPRAAAETARPAPEGARAPGVAEYLSATRVADLHRLGNRGAGVRVAILASEFPGAEALRGKYLTDAARVIDLTAELSPDVRPAPPSAARPGVGTVAAAVVQAAAPGAEVTLVRVDPAAFHQLLTVARAAGGGQRYSEAMQSRAAELTTRAGLLTIRRNQATAEYQRAFSDLGDEPEKVKRRAAAEAAVEQLVADEADFQATSRRFTLLKAAVDNLRGTSVVVNTLVWDVGFPQDGLDELSRYLDVAFTPRPVRSALAALKQPPVPVWVQAASTAVGQAWAGPFLDADQNGVMEFAPPAAPLPPGRWTRELNFLGFDPNQAPAGSTAATLPAGLRLRVTVQWREPQDPEGYLLAEPVFPFTVRLLRQVDPEGRTVASDEFVEVGRSSGPAVRLLKTAASAAFEQSMEVTVPADGVYALRVEGGAAFQYQLPALRARPEITPRVVIEATDDATAAKGRAVFRTFSDVSAGVGVPGASPAAVTVGVPPAGSGPRTLTGAGPGVTLRTKPDLQAAGALDVGGMSASGSGVAAAFVGGAAASLASAGVRASDLTRSIGLTPGQPLVLPQPLFDQISPRVRR